MPAQDTPSANAAAARAFFTRRRSAAELEALRAETAAVHASARASLTLSELITERAERETAKVARERADRAKKAAAVARAKRWAQANPERVSAFKKDWAERNPEKAHAAQREYAARNREALRDRTRAWRHANPEKYAEQRRRLGPDPKGRERARARAADPEIHAHDVATRRARRQLLTRLERAGLPKPITRPTDAHERSVHAAEARAFFERIKHRDARFIDPPSVEELQNAARERAWIRRGETRRAEREKFERERDQRRARLDQYIQRHRNRVRIEVQMDSTAREMRGLPPYDVDAETRRRLSHMAHGRIRLEVEKDPNFEAAEVDAEARRRAAALAYPQPLLATPAAETGDIWVRSHTRNGAEVEGHWRARQPPELGGS